MTDTTFAQAIYTKAARANPYPIYAQMRAANRLTPVIGPMTGNTFWFATHYHDCVALLKDQRFGKSIRKRLPPEILERFPPPDPLFETINNNMLFTDPPDHTRLRSLVHKAFTPRMIENLRSRIVEISEGLLDAMQDSHETDLIESFALPLPITVIAELLGIPVAERDQFRAWSQAILFQVPEQSAAAAMEFVMYFHALFDERRKNPGDDLISALVQTEEAGMMLSTEELTGMIFLLLVAGHETTVNLIGNGTLALIQHPDQMRKLQADPLLVKNAVEEMLRYNGPVEIATVRWAFEDVAIGDQVIPIGDALVVSLAAANHDPAVFEHPETFDITRDAHKHIAFGQGIHYCLGAPLARLEGTIAIGALVKRLPDIELAVDVDDLAWSEGLLLHGMKAMPVRY